MPAVLVGAEIDGRANFMTVAWCGIAAQTPPAIAVAIRKQRYTLKGIDANGAFSVNVPSAKMMKQVDYCGIYSGNKIDKSEVFTVARGDFTGVPLVEECPLNLECKVVHRLDLGSHTLVVGEIVQTHVSRDCLDESGRKVLPDRIDPLVYTPSSQQYRRLGEAVGKAFHDGRQL